MDQYKFWEIFHKAWGNDRGEKSNRPQNYNKKAWKYVQDKVNNYLEEKEKPKKKN